MLALARSFRALQQQDLAEECLEEAARLGAAGQWPEISIEAHSQLAELYIDAGRYQPALVHRKALHALIAAQHQEQGQPLQLPRQATSQLRKLERELEPRSAGYACAKPRRSATKPQPAGRLGGLGYNPLFALPLAS
jgi:hypothetical protein